MSGPSCKDSNGRLLQNSAVWHRRGDAEMEQNILATACGRVQGVGFRYFVQRQATALGICGWVKNCEDGSVRMLLQGERAAVEKLLDILREGTVWIAVDQLLTEQVLWEAYPKEGSFWIRY